MVTLPTNSLRIISSQKGQGHRDIVVSTSSSNEKIIKMLSSLLKTINHRTVASHRSAMELKVNLVATEVNRGSRSRKLCISKI